MARIQDLAFPRLTSAEVALVSPLATARDYADGETIFRAGQADIDLVIVETGRVEIRNPADGQRVIAVHEPGEFAGDIDVLTGRPVIVTAVARGKTRVLCVPGSQLRTLLNRVPSVGEKLIVAFTSRREILAQSGVIGLRVVGPARCRATNTVREFLYKNFFPFTWFDPESEQGRMVLAALGSDTLFGRVRFHRRRAGGGLAAGGPRSRRERLSPYRLRHRPFGLVPQTGS
ncbi:MAG: cyclic nucleotide-binding domain-containing protein [Thermoguttaceae bacterium]|jgi:thioredoxin reductase (NADPH)